MAYVKKTWENKPSTASPINANNLNHMEQGIKDNDDHIENVDLYLQTIALEVNNLQSEKMNKANPTFTGNMTGGTNITITGDYTNGYGETLHGKQDMLTFDNVPTSGSDNPVKSNGIYDMIIDSLPVDTESGNPCVITDGYLAPTKSLKLTLEPIQDLHGYDKPWAGGALNVVNPYTYTDSSSGVYFAYSADGSFQVNGTPTTPDGSALPVRSIAQSNNFYTNISAGTYTPWITSIENVGMQVIDVSNGNILSTGNPFTISEAKDVFLRILVTGSTGGTASGYLQLVRGSVALPYTNICPISGRTQAKITRTGKNLYIGSPSFDGYVGLNSWTKDTQTYNGHDVYKKNAAWNGLYKLVYLPVGTYTFTCAIKADSATSVYMYIVGNTTAEVSPVNKIVSVGTSWSVVSVTFAVTVAGTVACRIEKDVSSANYVYISEYQIEVGSSATDYEAYNGTNYTIQLGQTVYGGVLNVTSGALSIDYVKKIYNGTERWQGVQNRRYIEESTFVKLSDYVGSIYCDKLETVANDQAMSQSNCITGYRDYGPYYDSNWLYLNVSADTGGTSFLNWLDTNKPEVVFKLATPTTVQLTPTQIALLKGDNVLTTDANNIECEYSADIALYIAKKIAEGSQGNRSLSKGGSSEETEEVKKEEVKEEEKKEEIEIKEVEPLTKEVR